MSEHTSGPWFADEYKVWAHKETTYQGGVKQPIYSYKIADVALHHPWRLDEQYANAHLIAAAPELLESCKTIIRAYENADVVPEALNLAYAAVVKAEGRVNA